MPIYTIYADDANSAEIQSTASTGLGYSFARAGTGTLTLVDASPTTVGQQFLFEWGVFQPLWGFDTSGVLNTVVSATLRARVLSPATVSHTIEVRLYDFGAGAPTTGDYLPGASLAAATLLATLASTAIPTGGGSGAWFDFVNVAFQTNVNQAGYTRIVLSTDRIRTGTPPTDGNVETTGWYSPDAAGTTDDPRLIIVSPLAAVTAAATLTGVGTIRADVVNVPLVNPLPLEVRVYGKAAPGGSPIAVWEGQAGLSWHDPFNAIGAASLTLPLADPKAIAVNLATYNLVRCFMGPFDVFDFWIETPRWTVVGRPSLDPGGAFEEGAFQPAFETASGQVGPLGTAEESVVVAGRGLEAYLERAVVWLSGATYTSESAGAIMADQVTAAQARGALGLLRLDFSAAADSAGVPWAGTLASLTMTVAEGTNLLSLLGSLRQAGVLARMRSDFTLQLWQSFGVNQATNGVVLRAARHLNEPVSWTQPQAEAANAMIVRGAAGVAVALVDAGPTLPDRFEGYVKGPDSDDIGTLYQVATTEILRRYRAQVALAFNNVDHGLEPGRFEPYRHYRPGDTIGLDVPGRLDSTVQRVAAINVTSGDEAVYRVGLDLASVTPIPEVALAQAVRALQQPG